MGSLAAFQRHYTCSFSLVTIWESQMLTKKLSPSTNRAQSFWMFSSNGAMSQFVKFLFYRAECKSVSLYVNQMFVPRMELDSPFNNYISRKSKWSSAYSTLCCVAVFLILHCQLHLAAGAVEHCLDCAGTQLCRGVK